jgi:hypothetical protein
MTSRTGPDSLRLVSNLIEIGKADTVYRDVYLDRARALLGAVLSLAAYRHGEQMAAQVQELPLRIQRAVEWGSWPEVKELGAALQAMRAEVADKRALMETGRQVYAVNDVLLDPFSPGLQGLSGFSGPALAALRDRSVEQLAGLEREDAAWKDFYAGRRRVLQGLKVAVTETGSAATAEAAAGAPTGDVRAAALEALKSGNIRGLQALADAAMQPTTSRPGAPRAKTPPAASTPAPDRTPPNLAVPFSEATLKRARGLGLAVRHLEPRPEIASLRDYAWSPIFSDEPGQIDVRKVPLPAGTPEGMRERFEMLMIHPLVNSGGARHLPTLVAEDVLVEDVPDPVEGKDAPPSALLTALGLAGRRALPRTRIEQALLEHGAHLLEKELGLDPRAFRLVCIPPDVHLRLGEAEGWGRQPVWTHFDGYLVLRNGHLRALAGGNARFGGLFNLVGIGRDYDADTVITRFAVVRRERMVAC